MSDGFGRAREGAATATTNLASTMGIASGLVAANVVLMLALSYTPVVDLGRLVFSNFFLGIAAFAVTVVVYRTDHSFERWNRYSAGLFVGGVVVGAVGVFVATPLLLVAGLCFFAGFLVYLFHEVWAVKTSAYPGTLVNAIGIYVAVMGVFVHVLQWVLRAMQATRA